MKKLFATTLLSTAVAFSAQAQDVTGTIHANQGTQKINKEIYGQFAEHLGSCIYGGLWVGPDSKIPNTQGYRNDVLPLLPLDVSHRDDHLCHWFNAREMVSQA